MEQVLQKYLQRSQEMASVSMDESLDSGHGNRLLQLQDKDAVQLIAELVGRIRPSRAAKVDYAIHAVQALCHLLNRNEPYVRLVRNALLHLLGRRKPVSLYVDSGIQPSSGFFSEMRRRIGHRLLPDAIDPAYLKDLFATIFTKTSDEKWVQAVPDHVWLELLEVLRFHEAPAELLAACQRGLLDAAQVLSYRLSASGLHPELIRNHAELEDHASPFITQNVELGDFLAAPADNEVDINHILVMLDQCRQIINRIRRNSSQTGTSINLTFLLQGMSQQIGRLELLLGIIEQLRAGKNTHANLVELFKTLVSAECHKNDIRMHWRGNVEILALRVTENASRTGEHYITESRSEYFALMRSAMGAGLVIGIMAMIKIITADRHYAPLLEAILFSLNYGLGFVLIHILHFTVATKQPAMTAAAIAASIDTGEHHGRERPRDRKNKNLDHLVTIIAQTMRSQTVAIFGNVVVVVPVAMLIGWGIYTVTGQHFTDVAKSQRLLASIDPLYSGSVFYASIAGVCLFLSGLIAGYHDNVAIYHKIPQRLMALGWLQALLGPARLARVARYIENNLGALAGNFYFGCLLGGMAAIGVLLGLPIDIRHITFSSAFVGFAFVGLDFNVTGHMVLMAALGVLLIGTMNLLVSFSLALYVAMKSRKLNFAQWRILIKAVLTRLNHHPGDFLLPPKKLSRAEQQGQSAHAGHSADHGH